jgi:hypothetical protein
VLQEVTAVEGLSGSECIARPYKTKWNSSIQTLMPAYRSNPTIAEGGAGGIERLVRCGMTEQGLLLRPPREGVAAKAVEVLDVLGDEEHLPFPPGSFDLVVRSVRCWGEVSNITPT